jgi:hypothetical protein
MRRADFQYLVLLRRGEALVKLAQAVVMEDRGGSAHIEYHADTAGNIP